MMLRRNDGSLNDKLKIIIEGRTAVGAVKAAGRKNGMA